jgi:hypothetical protein
VSAPKTLDELHLNPGPYRGVHRPFGMVRLSNWNNVCTPEHIVRTLRFLLLGSTTKSNNQKSCPQIYQRRDRKATAHYYYRRAPETGAALAEAQILLLSCSDPFWHRTHTHNASKAELWAETNCWPGDRASVGGPTHPQTKFTIERYNILRTAQP